MEHPTEDDINNRQFPSTSSLLIGTQKGAQSRRNGVPRCSPNTDLSSEPKTQTPATSVVWSPDPQLVPSLVNIIISKLARHPQYLAVDALDSLDGFLATALLRQIMFYKKLNTTVALEFIKSRHTDLADALSRLDLVAGVPATMQLSP